MDDSDATTTAVVDLGKIKPVESLPGDIRGCLQVINGPEKGRVIYLENPYNTIGRSKSNIAILSGTEVSGTHALIFFSESMEWRVEDLGSTNGTLLNGSKVKEYALRSGDKILIGTHLMVFTIENV